MTGIGVDSGKGKVLLAAFEDLQFNRTKAQKEAAAKMLNGVNRSNLLKFSKNALDALTEDSLPWVEFDPKKVIKNTNLCREMMNFLPELVASRKMLGHCYSLISKVLSRYAGAEDKKLFLLNAAHIIQSSMDRDPSLMKEEDVDHLILIGIRKSNGGSVEATCRDTLSHYYKNPSADEALKEHIINGVKMTVSSLDPMGHIYGLAERFLNELTSSHSLDQDKQEGIKKKRPSNNRKILFTSGEYFL